MSDAIAVVHLLPSDRIEKTPVGSFLASVIVRSGVDMVFDCDGQGLCSTCRVRIESGGENLTPITDADRIQLGEDVDRGWRLSCLPRVTGDVTVLVPEGGFAYPPELQREG